MNKEQDDAIARLSPEIQRLVARLMLHSSQDNQHVLNSVVASLQDENYRYRAELLIIRRQINYLINGTYMPTSTSIYGCLYPSEEAVAALANELKERDNK
jgi:hypothetical protein